MKEKYTKIYIIEKERRVYIINIINILKKYNWIKIIFMTSIHSSKYYYIKYIYWNINYIT